MSTSTETIINKLAARGLALPGHCQPRGNFLPYCQTGSLVFQCLPGFDQSPAVINGASDLLIDLFGPAGRHARTAVGVSGLPANAAVEVDAVFEIDL